MPTASVTLCRFFLLIAWLTLSATARKGQLRSSRRLNHRKLRRAADRSLAVLDQYIVVLVDGVDVSAKTKSLLSDCTDKNSTTTKVLFEYFDDIRGFAVSGLSEDSLWQILDDDQVKSVQEDQVIYSYVSQTQVGPSWGLDRIDQEDLPVDERYRFQYTGKGVDVYIVDSGILSTHEEFNGRVRCGFDAFLRNPLDAALEDVCTDTQGHGSHVAAVAGGAMYGVAKEVQLVSIKVLDAEGGGTVSAVVAALDYIVQQKRARPDVPAVVNLSLGGLPNTLLDEAVEVAVENGVVMVVAAGNENEDACLSSPARVSSAITVGSSNWSDEISAFSNYGSCVDIFAPGEKIKSAWGTTNTETRSISGTSMASPFVVGVAALYLEANPSWSPAQVWNAMLSDSTEGKLIIQKSKSGSPNRIVNAQQLYIKSRDSDTTSSDTVADTTETTTGDSHPSKAPVCATLFKGCATDADCCDELACYTFVGLCFS